MRATHKTRWSNALTQSPEGVAFDQRAQLVAPVQPDVKVGQVVELWTQDSVRCQYFPYAVYIAKKMIPTKRVFVPEQGFGPQNGWYENLSSFGVELRLIMKYPEEGQTHAPQPRKWTARWNGKQNQLFWNSALETNQLQDVITMPDNCHIYVTNLEDYISKWKAFYTTGQMTAPGVWNNQNRGPTLPRWIKKLAGKHEWLIDN